MANKSLTILKMRYLKNIDVIEVDVWKDQHYRLISLEEACLNFFRMMRIKNTSNSIKTAIATGILLFEETEQPFNFDLLLKIKGRVEQYIDISSGKNEWRSLKS